ncbi:MAG: YihY/virulence factor BrkB family protein [Deltaproteobacteria bacterium]|nr:MAG: YihY/virulence factor BrkB family protein [Deltaproteobacteria bacterium]
MNQTTNDKSTVESDEDKHIFMSTSWLQVCRGFFQWSGRIIKEFWSNNGLVLASAVAYNVFLSTMPLLALLLMALSYVLPEQLVMESISKNVQFLLPGASQHLLHDVKSLLDSRGVFGWIGSGVLVFFSALAFSVTGNAIQQIFAETLPETEQPLKQSKWFEFILPYIYVVCLALGLLLWIGISTTLQYLPAKTLSFLGLQWSTSGASKVLMFVLSFIGLWLLLASMYKLLPKQPISYRRALVGGAVTAVLWEMLRPILVWYFAKISMVNVIYGSITSIVVVLLCFEIGAVVFLLGAQVIADGERKALESKKAKETNAT